MAVPRAVWRWMIRVGAEALGALLIALLMGDRKRRPKPPPGGAS